MSLALVLSPLPGHRSSFLRQLPQPPLLIPAPAFRQRFFLGLCLLVSLHGAASKWGRCNLTVSKTVLGSLMLNEKFGFNLRRRQDVAGEVRANQRHPAVRTARNDRSLARMKLALPCNKHAISCKGRHVSWRLSRDWRGDQRVAARGGCSLHPDDPILARSLELHLDLNQNLKLRSAWNRL